MIPGVKNVSENIKAIGIVDRFFADEKKPSRSQIDVYNYIHMINDKNH